MALVPTTMSFFPPSTTSVAPNTNLTNTSPPLLVLAAFSGVAVLGSAALACFIWTKSRARRMSRATFVVNEYSRDMREMERTKAGSLGKRPEIWDLWTEKDEEADRYATGKHSWENVMPLSAMRTYDTTTPDNGIQDVKRKPSKEVEKGDDIPEATRCQITMAIAMPSPRNHRPEGDDREELEYCIGVMEVHWDKEEG